MKAYRFFSEPNKLVSDGNTGLPLFRFDENGEYVTLDRILAKRIGVRFECKEVELVEVKEQAEEIKKEQVDSTDDFVCTVCGFKAANKSGLVNHMRKHKEGQ